MPKTKLVPYVFNMNPKNRSVKVKLAFTDLYFYSLLSLFKPIINRRIPSFKTSFAVA